MVSKPAPAQHLRDLALLRRVRDRIDREYAQPLDVEALARGEHMSAGHLSRRFRLAFGESPDSYLMTRRIERAMALLRGADRRRRLPWSETPSLGMFSTRFAELVGMSAQRLSAPGDGRDVRGAAVRGQAGDETDQESRSVAGRPARSMTAMDITIHQAMLPHDDPEASRLSIATSSASRSAMTSSTPGCIWITIGPAGQPGTSIVLSRGGHPRHHRRRAADDRRDDRQGHVRRINLATEDLDGTFAWLESGDAEVVQEPTDQPYGIRDCAFRDPAGNLIRIQEVRRDG